ncbi:MAG: hypothetical protein IKJ63_02750 [Clostridia bacterium]|nr:hypothetical protein [Clostridia bacterium]
MNERSFETLLYSVTAATVAKIMELNGWTEDAAMERFTQSRLYTYLEQEETKVWQYSALMLATLFNEERTGRLILPEV